MQIKFHVLAVALGMTAVLAACQPPEPPPPRPPPTKTAPAAEAAPVLDPQVVQARRSEGLSGGTLVFEDHFDRAELGEDWLVKQPGEWLIDAGVVRAIRVEKDDERNQGLWLLKPLPDKARIEFDSRSLSAAGDCKCEVFGDAPKHESGYSVIFGGWNNTLNVIARRGEHETSRVVQREHQKVESNRLYHWMIVRTDNVVRWYLDGKFIVAYDDADPVKGHQFGWNNWATDVRFDDLRIFAL